MGGTSLPRLTVLRRMHNVFAFPFKFLSDFFGKKFWKFLHVFRKKTEAPLTPWIFLSTCLLLTFVCRIRAVFSLSIDIGGDWKRFQFLVSICFHFPGGAWKRFQFMLRICFHFP